MSATRVFFLFLIVASMIDARGQAVATRAVPTLAVGGTHVLALKWDGSVWAWGRNDYGQLGLGVDQGTADVRTPTRIVALDNLEIVALAAGTAHSMALTSNGDVYVWGRNDHGQLGNGTSATSGSVGSSSVPVRVAFRRIYALNGVQFTQSPMPRISRIAAGGTHCLALPAEYEISTSSPPGILEKAVLAWGGNAKGQTGTNTTVDQLWPRPSNFTAHIVESSRQGSEITEIAAGLNHSLFAASNTSVTNYNVYGAGDNTYGQIGGMGGTASSVYVHAFLNYLAPCTPRSGANHSLAFGHLFYLDQIYNLQTQIYSFGRNASGQIGIGTATASEQDYIWGSTTDSKVVDVALGANHTVALRADGSLLVWGENGTHQLGLGTTADRKVPVAHTGISNIFRIAAGGNSTFAIKRDGSVWAWGANADGQLGLGHSNNRPSPTKLTAFSMGSDTDADGVDDSWELHYFNTLTADLTMDHDEDELTSRQEYDLGLNPRLVDTDGDLLSDGYEVSRRYLNAGVPNASELDHDQDGLSALEEHLNNSDPKVSDTDGDGVSDGME